MTNLSTRAQVLTGDNILDGGFIITGTESKDILIRGIGPSLSSPGLSGVLADPTLELHGPNSSALLATNDNWQDTQDDIQALASRQRTTSSQPSPLSCNRAPTRLSLPARMEARASAWLKSTISMQRYDSMLANISTRGSVGTGDDVLIGGFILGPDGGASSTILVRAIGPSLAAAQVAGPLEDPEIELYDSNGASIAFNDNWKDTQQTDIEATGLRAHRTTRSQPS